jgi:hypothetical protein
LPFRVSKEDAARLSDLFGPVQNPKTGALRIDGLWECLRRLGDSAFGGGRWLPQRTSLKGEEAGLSWTAEVVAQDGIYDQACVQDARIIMRFPGGERKSEVSLSRLYACRVVANFGCLAYYQGGTLETPVLTEFTAGSELSFIGKCLNFYLWGQTFYTIDAPCREPTQAFTDVAASVLGVRGLHSTSAPIVAVPHALVQELYPKAAGRDRSAELLRSLIRHAEVIVSRSSLVHPSCRGVVVAKLAFIAMAFNERAEIEMYRTLIPGALDINEAAKRAFEKPPPGGGHLKTLLIAGSVWALYRNRKAVRRTVSRVLGLTAGLATAFVGTSWIDNITSTTAAVTAAVDSNFLQEAWQSIFRVLPGSIFEMATGFGRSISQTSGAATNTPVTRGASSLIELLSIYGWCVVEEHIKRRHWLWEAALIGTEAWMHGMTRYWPTMGMHLLATRLPERRGILLHTLWNLVAVRPASLWWLVNKVFVRDGARDAEVDGTHDSYHFADVRPVPPPNDVCVDEMGLRDNEPVVGRNRLVHSLGLPTSGMLACQEPSKSWWWFAIAVEGVEVTQFRSCVCNERAAIMSRVTAVDNAENTIWIDWFSRARPVGVVPCPDQAKWMAHLPARARGLVARTTSTSVVDGWGQAGKCFVKREKAVTAINDKPVKQQPAPRLIQGRSVEVKIATGPFTWAYSKRLGEIYNTDGLYLYAGGKSAEQIGAFFDEIPRRVGKPGCSWYAIDARRWDRSVGPTIMKCLFNEYRVCGAPPDCLEALRHRDRRRHGVTTGGWKFSRIGQVSSGDGDTSGGNTRAHLAMLECCDEVYAAIAHGDDSLVYTDDIDAVLQQYVHGGFEPVLADEVDFCSAVFWPTEKGSVLGPKVGRVLAKTFFCASKFGIMHNPSLGGVHRFGASNSDYLPWLRGVCLSLRRSTRHIPLLRILIPHLLLLAGEGPVWRDDKYQYKSWCDDYHEVCEGTWEFFYQRYGLHESDVLDMEEEIKRTTIGSVLSGDRWVSLVGRDIVGTSYGT